MTAAVPGFSSDLHRRIAAAGKFDIRGPLSEAVVPGHVSEDDLRALPTKKFTGTGSMLERMREKQAKLAVAPAASVYQNASPVPQAMLDKQRAYLEAWKSRESELARLSPEEREASLKSLKQSIVGDGR